MKKIKFTLLASLVACISTSAAIANEIASEVVTATTDLVFSAQGHATISLTPSSDLVAGPQVAGKQVATGVAEATESSVAIRWTPASGTVTTENDLSTVIQIKGKNNSNNLATFVLVPNISLNQIKNGNNGWIVPVENNVSTLSFQVQQKDNAVVAGDTYVISVDAAVWAY